MCIFNLPLSDLTKLKKIKEIINFEHKFVFYYLLIYSSFNCYLLLKDHFWPRFLDYKSGPPEYVTEQPCCNVAMVTYLVALL